MISMQIKSSLVRQTTMQQFDFTNISVVPIGEEFVDLTLSRVHRQTPTKGFDIIRLRRFYTDMVTKTELNYRNKLSTILHEFPKPDGIHPLYTHLLRSIFDGDRYEFALGQVNTAKDLISKLSDDYVNLLEFSESLKQSRSLKVNAVGGMFSVVNEITSSLAYLEQLRLHMVRLPLVDPNLPTLLVSGYPNDDKACFMNRIDTKESAIFDFGYTEYNELRYQVIDSLGVLDKPSFGGGCDVVAALDCHLRAALVLFFLDVSGSCGYSVAHQAALFHSVRSLFVHKRLLVVCDETDLMQTCEQDWELVEEMNSGMEEDEEVVLPISDLRTEEGMMFVKKAACERLLDHRERPSCTAWTNARDKYVLAHQEWKDNISPQNLDDEDDDDTDLFLDLDVNFSLDELEQQEGLNQPEEEEEEFEMAKDCFIEEHKGQVGAAIGKRYQPLRVLIALALCSFVVGNTYGATIQQCLSTFKLFESIYY